MNTVAIIPKTHAMTAAGPATDAAFQAPNSQPEPMMVPSPVINRAKVPSSFLTFFSDTFSTPQPARQLEGSGNAPRRLYWGELYHKWIYGFYLFYLLQKIDSIDQTDDISGRAPIFTV